MELKNQWFTKIALGRELLRWINLRPEEGERTLLMFVIYTITSVGLLWLEMSTAGLFLDEYGPDKLPLIYIASAGIGSSLGFIYSWLQKILPLRRVIVGVAILMATPLLLFRVGLWFGYVKIAGITLAGITVFMMWLWMLACYVLNDLNTSITANQLFNIREIKRTYPLVSSGLLVADVLSGFSLPLLLKSVGLNNVTVLSGLMILLGAGGLLYLSRKYKQAFPDSSRWVAEDEQPDFATRRLKGPFQRYIIPLVTFFVIAEVLYTLIDFQFLAQVKENSPGAGGIATFLGFFNGTLGLFEVATQWFASSRLVERIGVFVTAMVLPAGIALLGIMSFISSLVPDFKFFAGFVILRFIDELLHHTLNESTGSILFQPIPDRIRSGVQALVNGVAEPLATGLTGFGILAIIWLSRFTHLKKDYLDKFQELIFVGIIVLLALGWLLIIWLLRSRYVGLLVSSAERGRLGVSDVDMRVLKRTVLEKLEQPGSEDDKRSCIELLTQIDPHHVSEVLAPLLVNLPPALQRQSLETMLNDRNDAYLNEVRALIDQPVSPEVLALALRYIWLTEEKPDIYQLRPYLQPEVDPIVRGTAASLIMRVGNRDQKAEATNALRRMLTSAREQERVMGTRAMGDADYLQALRIHIPTLLQDDSLRVRSALLDVIASAHLDEYYSALLRGLYYKPTREAAMQALVRLQNDAIPLLVDLAEDIQKPDFVRMYAWMAIGQIGTPEAIAVLASHLITSWGTTRRNILRILVKMPGEVGIEGVLDRFGRSGVETLIDQELMFMGQIYAALVDLNIDVIEGREAELFRRSLRDLESDGIDRLFLLMKFLYPLNSVQAAAFNLQSDSQSNMARGLEILDNVVDIPSKRALLRILDRMDQSRERELLSYQEKIQSLGELMVYRPMNPLDRIRHLLDLRHFLSDWPLACCFHIARLARWGLTADQILACLRHPCGFVREAVLAYLKVVSPRALMKLLPLLKKDPDRLVTAQVQQLVAELSSDSPKRTNQPPRSGNPPLDFPGLAGFETT